MKEGQLVTINVRGKHLTCKILKIAGTKVELQPLNRNSFFKGCAKISTSTSEITETRNRMKDI